MTNKEYLNFLLEESLREDGENASSMRMLREQLAAEQWAEKIRTRGEASEDLQPGEHQEDMYGNPVLSPEERAEAEEERQEEEGAN